MSFLFGQNLGFELAPIRSSGTGKEAFPNSLIDRDIAAQSVAAGVLPPDETLSTSVANTSFISSTLQIIQEISTCHSRHKIKHCKPQ